MKLADRTISGVACWYSQPVRGARGCPDGSRIRCRAFAASLAEALPELRWAHAYRIGQVVAYRDGAHALDVVAVVDHPARNPVAADFLGRLHGKGAYPPALSVGTGPTLWSGDELVAAALLEVSVTARGACPGAGVFTVGLPQWAGELL